MEYCLIERIESIDVHGDSCFIVFDKKNVLISGQ